MSACVQMDWCSAIRTYLNLFCCRAVPSGWLLVESTDCLPRTEPEHLPSLMPGSAAVQPVRDTRDYAHRWVSLWSVFSLTSHVGDRSKLRIELLGYGGVCASGTCKPGTLLEAAKVDSSCLFFFMILIPRMRLGTIHSEPPNIHPSLYSCWVACARSSYSWYVTSHLRF